MHLAVLLDNRGEPLHSCVTEGHADDNRLASVIRRADEALYLARKEGRDRAVPIDGSVATGN